MEASHNITKFLVMVQAFRVRARMVKKCPFNSEKISEELSAGSLAPTVGKIIQCKIFSGTL